jgi:hypothetical protein
MLLGPSAIASNRNKGWSDSGEIANCREDRYGVAQVLPDFLDPPEQKLGVIVGETNRASQNHVGDPRMFRQFDGRRSLGGQVAEDTQRVDSASMISKKSGDEALLGADTVLARAIPQGKWFHARVAAFDRIDVRLNFAWSNERHIHAKAILHGAARLIESHRS